MDFFFEEPRILQYDFNKRNSFDQAVQTSIKVAKHGRIANEISKMIEGTAEIFEQTNLLSLNATTESASVVN